MCAIQEVRALFQNLHGGGHIPNTSDADIHAAAIRARELLYHTPVPSLSPAPKQAAPVRHATEEEGALLASGEMEGYKAIYRQRSGQNGVDAGERDRHVSDLSYIKRGGIFLKVVRV